MSVYGQLAVCIPVIREVLECPPPLPPPLPLHDPAQRFVSAIFLGKFSSALGCRISSVLIQEVFLWLFRPETRGGGGFFLDPLRAPRSFLCFNSVDFLQPCIACPHHESQELQQYCSAFAALALRNPDRAAFPAFIVTMEAFTYFSAYLCQVHGGQQQTGDCLPCYYFCVCPRAGPKVWRLITHQPFKGKKTISQWHACSRAFEQPRQHLGSSL